MIVCNTKRTFTVATNNLRLRNCINTFVKSAVLHILVIRFCKDYDCRMHIFQYKQYDLRKTSMWNTQNVVRLLYLFVALYSILCSPQLSVVVFVPNVEVTFISDPWTS